ncbi:MAG: protein kinase, partial [Myxococcota bacterium]
MSLTTGAVIHHRYRVLRRLGTGGLGSTYEVWDANRGLPVALKVLDRWGGERHLRREFALLRGVVHPHLLRVRDLGVLSPADPRPFYTSDRIDGRSLDAWAKTQPFPRVLGALADAVSGLVYLHLLGVRHGDFKPSNVLMSSAGGAVLIDLSAASALARLDVRGASDVSGTPGFMAPEVATGDIDRRSDLFSVGVTLTRLAEGRDDVSDEALALGRRLSSPDKTARLVDGEAVLDALDALGASAHALTDRRRTRPFTSPVFLGRESAFTRFDAFLERLLSGHAGTRVFRIEGPSGSGRSQLLTELKWRAQPQLITIEGQPRNPRPVAELLSRLDGTDEESGGALDRIAKSLAHAGEGEPRILVLDDADRMPVTARERWAQLLRGLPADGPLGVLTVSEDPLAEDEDIYRLVPLGEADLRRWCAQVGAPEIAPRRMRRAVGNQIVLVEPLLRHLVAGGRPEDFVAAAPSIAERPFREVEVLATVALSLQGIEEATMGALGLDADAVAGLRRDGLLRSTDGVLRLQAEAYRQAVLEQLSDDVRTRAEAELRASLPMHGDPAHAATIQRLLLRGQRDDAEAMVLELEVAGPRAYRDVARQLGAESRRREVRRWSGEILVAAGDPQAALEVVEELLSDGKDFSALHLAGEAYLKLSRPDDAVRWERAAASVADTPTRRASLADLQARIAIAQGNPDAALRAARAALELTPPARLCDRLTESVGLASAYLGDSETADTALAEALQGHAARHDLAGRFRTHSYRAIAGQLAGAFDRAAEDYRAAIALAEQGEFDDQLAAAWLNLATVEQERGAYAAALDGYERALRFSILLGRTGTEGTVRFNLANLALEIGLLERADGELARAAALAKDLGLTQLEVPLRRLRGELALRRGEHPSARKAFLESRRLAESRGLLRDEAEASLFLAELAHREVDPRQTGRELARAEALIERADRPRDLMQRLRLLRAAAAGERGDLETA